jgi:hypothetical protein
VVGTIVAEHESSTGAAAACIFVRPDENVRPASHPREDSL